MNNSDNASNILIRNLSKEDNEMLSNLREILHKKNNTQAVMTAAYRYLELRERHEDTNKELRIALTKIEKLTMQYKDLQKEVAEYLALNQEKAEKEQALLSATVKRPLEDFEEKPNEENHYEDEDEDEDF